jgi:DNA-binding NtrC family response regulator
MADLIITDLRLPGIDGLQFIQQLQARGVQAAIIVITAHGSIEAAVDAMKLGAADFLQKPFSLDHFGAIVQKVMALQSLRAENQRMREELDRRYQFDNIIGRSPAMREIFHTVERVAPTRATVLLAGESGVGKDMIARAIHQHSPRKNHAFVKINCTALPENLMESELFGYEKGAFTGANASKPGKFEQADQGTAFLDEIGDVPGSIQVKLLRILQERQFERLGSNVTRNVDVRVIAATNVDLRAALEEGRFREDLYYRLKVVTLRIPPLRERPGDIAQLAEHFLALFFQEHGKAPKRLGSAAMDLLLRYPWPGNVRQLRNVIESAVVFCQGEEITPADLPVEVRESATISTSGTPVQAAAGEPRSMADIERHAILETLERTAGHRAKAADLLGIGLRTLQRKLKEYKDEGYIQED